MAAISSRLANMGFMKRAQAAKPDAQLQVKQEPQQSAPPSLRQQQQQHPAVKQEPGADFDSQVDMQAGAGSSKKQQEGKFKLSENITNMKFMQRAQLKRSRDEAFDQEQAAKDAAEWVSATATQDRGCLILHERDPLPAGASGRMSFGFGHLHDIEQAEEAERKAAAEAAAAEVSIKDEEMGRYGMQSGKGFRGKDMARHEAKRQKRR